MKVAMSLRRWHSIGAGRSMLRLLRLFLFSVFVCGIRGLVRMMVLTSDVLEHVAFSKVDGNYPNGVNWWSSSRLLCACKDNAPLGQWCSQLTSTPCMPSIAVPTPVDEQIEGFQSEVQHLNKET